MLDFARRLNALRQMILAIGKRGAAIALDKDLRRLAILAIRAGRDLPNVLARINATAQQHATTTAAWIKLEDIRAGRSGPFDACDLLVWLALADRAAVASVPAQVILTLSEAEMSEASGKVTMPAGPLKRRFAKAVATHLPTADGASLDTEFSEEDVDREALGEKLFAAMDEVPEGWMVRHTRCGPSSLKSLAGVGLLENTAPEVRFDANLEVGPGWVRLGNRRRVDVSDDRIVRHGAAEGPDGDQIFVARPWVTASRWSIGEDPHRRNSRFAGPGRWPAEWRAFVEGGQVVGVAAYYAWAWKPSQKNARVALEVRKLAQGVIDAAASIGAHPAFMPLEFLRDHPQAQPINDRFPVGSINASLDFIETDEGILLLEGGPAFYGRGPIGGGHPCAFAGAERPVGVAFTTMEGINIAEVATWQERDRHGAIMRWDEVQALADWIPGETPVPGTRECPATHDLCFDRDCASALGCHLHSASLEQGAG